MSISCSGLCVSFRTWAVGVALLLPFALGACASGQDSQIAKEIRRCEEEILKDNGTTKFIESVASERFGAWKAAADKGDSAGQWLIGRCLENGIVVDKDEKAAFAVFERLTKQGSVLAKRSLALMLTDGGDAAHDYPSAIRIFRELADGGYADAQYRLGLMYASGREFPSSTENDEKAVVWLRKAADQNHLGAQCDLAKMFGMQRGVSLSDNNDRESVAWLRKAAEQGHPGAQCQLGVMYWEKRGVDKSEPCEQLAGDWYRKSAEQDYPIGMFLYSKYKLYTYQSDQDLRDAWDLINRAADGGFELAQQTVKYGRNASSSGNVSVVTVMKLLADRFQSEREQEKAHPAPVETPRRWSNDPLANKILEQANQTGGVGSYPKGSAAWQAEQLENDPLYRFNVGIPDEN